MQFADTHCRFHGWIQCQASHHGTCLFASCAESCQTYCCKVDHTKDCCYASALCLANLIVRHLSSSRLLRHHEVSQYHSKDWIWRGGRFSLIPGYIMSFVCDCGWWCRHNHHIHIRIQIKIIRSITGSYRHFWHEYKVLAGQRIELSWLSPFIFQHACTDENQSLLSILVSSWVPWQQQQRSSQHMTMMLYAMKLSVREETVCNQAHLADLERLFGSKIRSTHQYASWGLFWAAYSSASPYTNRCILQTHSDFKHRLLLRENKCTILASQARHAAYSCTRYTTCMTRSVDLL